MERGPTTVARCQAASDGTRLPYGPAPREPGFDENGVDLAQIRAMLELTPAERLERVFGITTSLLAARGRHGTSGSD